RSRSAGGSVAASDRTSAESEFSDETRSSCDIGRSLRAYSITPTVGIKQMVGTAAPLALRGLSPPYGSAVVTPPYAGSSSAATWAISAAPMRSQLCAVSLIRKVLCGVVRSIGALHTAQVIEVRRSSRVTSLSLYCLHASQRMRRSVRSAVEKPMANRSEFPPELYPAPASEASAGRVAARAGGRP